MGGGCWVGGVQNLAWGELGLRYGLLRILCYYSLQIQHYLQVQHTKEITGPTQLA